MLVALQAIRGNANLVIERKGLMREFQRAIVGTIARVPQVVENIETLRALRADSPHVADTGADSRLALAVVSPSDNAALDAWRRSRA